MILGVRPVNALATASQIDPELWLRGRQALDQATKLFLADPEVLLIDLGFLMEPEFVLPELVVRIHLRATAEATNSGETSSSPTRRFAAAGGMGVPVQVLRVPYALNRAVADSSTRRRSRAQTAVKALQLGSFGNDEQVVLAPRHSWRLLAREIGAPGERVRGLRQVPDLDVVAIPIPPFSRLAFTRTSQTIIGAGVPPLGMPVVTSGPRGEGRQGIVTGILGCGRLVSRGASGPLRALVHITVLDDEEAGRPGDSGQLWLDAGTGRVVALHLAVGGRFAVAHALPTVLHALGLRMSESAPARLIALRSGPSRQARQSSKPRRVTPPVREDAPQRRLTMATRLGLQVAVAALLSVTGWLQLKVHHKEARTERQRQLTRLRSRMEALQGLLATEQMRRDNIARVRAVIDRYNPAMPESLKVAIAEEIHRAALKFPNLDVDLVCATITHESARTWDPEIVSPAEAMGLMQILERTGIVLAELEGLTWTTKEEILFNPVYNIRLGCRYLSMLIEAYDLDGGLAAYNGGEWRVERWLRAGRRDGILRDETSIYITSVFDLYETLQKSQL